MINTKGPQKNLTLPDRLFLLSWMVVCFAILSLFFGIWDRSLISGVVTTCILLSLMFIYERFGKAVQNWLKRGTENMHDSELPNYGYLLIMVISLIVGIVVSSWNTDLSNKAVMVAQVAFGIFIANGILTVTMQSLLGRAGKDEETSRTNILSQKRPASDKEVQGSKVLPRPPENYYETAFKRATRNIAEKHNKGLPVD